MGLRQPFFLITQDNSADFYGWIQSKKADALPIGENNFPESVRKKSVRRSTKRNFLYWMNTDNAKKEELPSPQPFLFQTFPNYDTMPCIRRLKPDPDTVRVQPVIYLQQICI